MLRVGAWACLVPVLTVAACCFLWPYGSAIRAVLIEMWLWATPTPGLRNRVGPEDIEQLMNLVAFVPIVGLMALALPRVPTPAWWFVSLIGGSGIETMQYFFLPDRRFDPVDALFNAIGGFLGSYVAWGVQAILARWGRR